MLAAAAVQTTQGAQMVRAGLAAEVLAELLPEEMARPILVVVVVGLHLTAQVVLAVQVLSFFATPDQFNISLVAQ